MAFMEFGPGSVKVPREKKKRTVVLLPRAAEQRGGVLFAFGYADLADWCGVEVATIRTSVSKGDLDPTCLDSLLKYRLKARRAHS